MFTSENTSNLSNPRRDLDKAFDLLCKLDVTKSCGPDEVPACLLREGAPWLADPITMQTLQPDLTPGLSSQRLEVGTYYTCVQEGKQTLGLQLPPDQPDL